MRKKKIQYNVHSNINNTSFNVKPTQMPSGAEQLNLEGPVSEAAQLQANWVGCSSQGLPMLGGY